MRRTILPFAAFLSIVVLPAVADDDKPSGILVPDPDYDPKAGDQVTLYWRSPRGMLQPVACAKYVSDINDWAKRVKAGDQEGLEEMEKKGKVFDADSGTQIRIIEVLDYYDPDVCRVRILDGKHKGTETYTLAQFCRSCRVVQPKKRR